MIIIWKICILLGILNWFNYLVKYSLVVDRVDRFFKLFFENVFL